MVRLTPRHRMAIHARMIEILNSRDTGTGLPTPDMMFRFEQYRKAMELGMMSVDEIPQLEGLDPFNNREFELNKLFDEKVAAEIEEDPEMVESRDIEARAGTIVIDQKNFREHRRRVLTEEKEKHRADFVYVVDDTEI
jgi:hypothetical protein